MSEVQSKYIKESSWSIASSMIKAFRPIKNK